MARQDHCPILVDVHNKKTVNRRCRVCTERLIWRQVISEAKAMFYYQSLLHSVGKGDTAAACESFKNAGLLRSVCRGSKGTEDKPQMSIETNLIVSLKNENTVRRVVDRIF